MCTYIPAGFEAPFYSSQYEILTECGLMSLICMLNNHWLFNMFEETCFALLNHTKAKDATNLPDMLDGC